MKNKILLIIILASTTSCSMKRHVQQKVNVLILSDSIDVPTLFYIEKNDTIYIQKHSDSLFYDIPYNSKNEFFIEYDYKYFRIGILDTLVKTIVLDYDKTIVDNCLVVSKVYNDVIQTFYNSHIKKCQKFTNIYLYNNHIFKIDDFLVPMRLYRKEN